jgi:predicted SAM-dependent methyltransferase
MTDTPDGTGTLRYPRTAFRFRRSVSREIDRLLASLRQRSRKGLHLGAGSSRIPGLINCDLFDPGADLKADATDLSMFSDNSIDLIESHHMIEHLSFADTEKALAEWHRVLGPGGVLVITCPDLSRVARRWVLHSFFQPLFPRPERMDYMVKMLVGSQEHDGMFHKNAFDARRMSRLLSRHGFLVEFAYTPYPRRPTPSLLVIARCAKEGYSSRIV